MFFDTLTKYYTRIRVSFIGSFYAEAVTTGVPGMSGLGVGGTSGFFTLRNRSRAFSQGPMISLDREMNFYDIHQKHTPTKNKIYNKRESL